MTRRQQVDDPFLEVVHADIESGGDDPALVDAPVQLHDDLSRSVIIHHGELANVSMLLHLHEEAHDDLAGGADQGLTLSTLLGVADRSERVCEYGHFHHC